jgi:hypothetical protein
VSVHADAAAAGSAAALGAAAYTVGSHIFFGAGRYDSQSRAGRRLLAHELAHTAQQSEAPAGAATRAPPEVPRGHALELEADRVADAVTAGDPARVALRTHKPVLARSWITCESGDVACPAREPGEEQRARRAPLSIGTLDAPEAGIIVSGFPIGTSDASTLGRVPGWSGFVAAIGTAGSRWEALGFSDCRGGEPLNTGLRLRRATAVSATLPAAVRAQIDRAAGAPLTDCVASNDSEANRAFNRSVVFRRTASEVTFGDEVVTARTCPPATGAAARTLDEYISLVACAEQTTGLPPHSMLALLRQLYYGKNWSTVSTTDKWDNVIPCSPNLGDPRTGRLNRNLYNALAAQDEIAGVDVGHVFTGLEAATCPAPEVDFYLGLADVGMSNVAFATWGGDLGAAVAAHQACPAMGPRAATEDDCGRRVGAQPLSFYWHVSASDQDLEGDIDAYVIRAGLLGIPCLGSGEPRLTLNRPVSSILRDYYTNSSSPLGQTRPNRARCMAEILGCRIAGGRITNRSGVLDTMSGPVASFAAAFYTKIYGGVGTPGLGESVVMRRSTSREVSGLFLSWLEARF